MELTVRRELTGRMELTIRRELTGRMELTIRRELTGTNRKDGTNNKERTKRN